VSFNQTSLLPAITDNPESLLSKPKQKSLMKGFTEGANGRLIVNDPEQRKEDSQHKKQLNEVNDMLKSQRQLDQTADGFQVVAGRVKFNKGAGTKRALEDMEEDEEMADIGEEEVMDVEVEEEVEEAPISQGPIKSRISKTTMSDLNKSRKEILKSGGKLRTVKTNSGRMMKQRRKKSKL
jgi:hypothetical protein